MAKFVSIQVHRKHENTMETLRQNCTDLGVNFNAMMNSLLPNLTEAIKTYNPTTRKANLNLGTITIQ